MKTLPKEDLILAGIIRRVLAQRFIIRCRQKLLFLELIARREQINRFFSKMSAELVIQDSLGIAYLSPIAEHEDEVDCSFGRKIKLGAYESLLVILLREKRFQYYANLEIETEIPLITREEMRQHLAQFVREKEDKKFERRFEQALLRLLKEQILLSTEDSTRYEISPVCDLVLSADRIADLKRSAEHYFSFKHTSLTDRPLSVEDR